MDTDEVFLTLEEKIENALEHTTHEFSGVNTGKANPAMVEGVQVEAYGSTMSLKEMAAISTPDARTIAVQPWDKSTLKSIEKALQTANLGITPAVMGDVIRLPLPELTRERRQELAKRVHKMAEDGKVAIRNARREANDSLKKLQKSGDITEDDLKTGEKDVQETVDTATKKIAALAEAKEKDLLTV
ncbi:MAG: ribosome recycling factor [Verrucomicrobiota bacterium]